MLANLLLNDYENALCKNYATMFSKNVSLSREMAL